MDPQSLIEQTNSFVESLARWTHFVTPTYRTSVTLDEAATGLRRWVETLARELGQHVHIAWCVERGGRFGRAHSHALLAPTRRDETIADEMLRRLWASDPSAGDIDVRRYISGGGAAEYIMKAERWSYGVVCPRQRECRRRCVGGRHPFLH